MMPIVLKLKKERHREVAKAQDLIVEELYKVFEKAVIHGGTAIWRCYGGNRFSEDVDVYIPRDKEKIDAFFSALEKKGLVVEKKKVGERSLFSNLLINRIYVRFEAIFAAHGAESKSTLGDYECIDGNFIKVYTLGAEELIKEKMRAYMSRLKIRDLYDTFFLLKYVRDKKSIAHELEKFVKSFKPPLDEPEIKVLIFEGIAPSADKMLEYIKNSI